MNSIVTLINRNSLISHRIKHKVFLLVMLTVFAVQVSDYLVSCNKSLDKKILSERRQSVSTLSLFVHQLSQICQLSILRLNLTSILCTTDFKLADIELRELRGLFAEVKEKSVVGFRSHLHFFVKIINYTICVERTKQKKILISRWELNLRPSVHQSDALTTEPLIRPQW